MSDLKWDRWSWSDSNSALQVLHDHRETEGVVAALCRSSSTTSSPRVSFVDVSNGSGEEFGNWRRRHESKKSAGTSKMERCRLSSFFCCCWSAAAESTALAIASWRRRFELLFRIRKGSRIRSVWFCDWVLLYSGSRDNDFIFLIFYLFFNNSFYFFIEIYNKSNNNYR